MTKYLALCLLSFHLLYSQDIGKAKIVQAGQCYYGSACRETEEDARASALAELNSQIAVKVMNYFEGKIIEGSGGLIESAKSVIRTYSVSDLQNVKTIKAQCEDGKIEVFCYLEKAEVQRIFNERKKLIAEMAKAAERYEQEGNYAHALKHYYFGCVLSQSLPEINVEWAGVNYTSELPNRINNILNKIRFVFLTDNKISDSEREIGVQVFYDERLVTLLDFTFWDGKDQVLSQAREGFASILLLGSGVNINELKPRIKYDYSESVKEYSALVDLWGLVDKPNFNAAYKSLSLRQAKANAASKKIKLTDSGLWNIKLNQTDNIPSADQIIQSTVQFLNIIEKGEPLSVNQAYAGDQFLRNKITDYIAFNSPKITDKQVTADLNKTCNGFELRRLQVTHRYLSIHKRATEYLVLDFSEDGVLKDINLCVYDSLYNRFVDETKFGSDWVNRQQIVKFLEKYRTAYQVRDTSIVSQMFSEDALIIVGRKIERKKMPDNMVSYEKLSKEQDYEKIKFTKREYIKRLKEIFNARKDIFLEFGSFDIVQKTNPRNVYGVEMRQNYTSTGYADEGYLFLLIDFREQDPLIYVRAWQPKAWDPKELIRTGDFGILK